MHMKDGGGKSHTSYSLVNERVGSLELLVLHHQSLLALHHTTHHVWLPLQILLPLYEGFSPPSPRKLPPVHALNS